MKSRFRFTAILTYLPEQEGGLSTPVSSGHRAAIKFASDSERVFGLQNFIDTDLVFPGDRVSAHISLPSSAEFNSRIYEGLDFEFYQGDILAGNGVITKISEKRL